MALCLAQYKPNSMINIFIRPVLTAYLPEAQKNIRKKYGICPVNGKFSARRICSVLSFL